jgi:hypothetical protein
LAAAPSSPGGWVAVGCRVCGVGCGCAPVCGLRCAFGVVLRLLPCRSRRRGTLGLRLATPHATLQVAQRRRADDAVDGQPVLALEPADG